MADVERRWQSVGPYALAHSLLNASLNRRDVWSSLPHSAKNPPCSASTNVSIDRIASVCPVKTAFLSGTRASHILTVASSEHDTSTGIVGCQRTRTIPSSCRNTWRTLNVLKSQILIVPSKAPVQAQSFAVANATHSTPLVSLSSAGECCSVPATFFFPAWHNLAVPSAEPDRKSGLSGLNARQTTSASWKPCPWNTWCAAPVLGFHTRTVSSDDAVTSHLPLPVKPPLVTVPSWPANTCITSPVAASHIHTVASAEPAASTLPLGCQASHSNSCDGPSNVCLASPVAASHTRTVPS
mmetsp:Transcript_1226/g.3579  ORF Transcript_1226/g.3579 Transcript_1226/m.3579 type:complete len:297 (+) Transcript_1226:871-1761(+)